MFRKHISKSLVQGKSKEKDGKNGQDMKFGDRTILDNMLSKNGRYAVSALTSVALATLYPEEDWKQFKVDLITDLLNYLNLPVENYLLVLTEMLDYDNHLDETYKCFTSLINDEEHCNENLVLQDLVYFALRKGCYDARVRVVLKEAIRFFEMPQDGDYNSLELFEELFISECFTGSHHKLTEEEHTERLRLIRRRKVRAAVAIGTSAVLLGALVGCTGGLAAPMIGLSGAAIFPGLTGTFLASSAGMAIVGSLFAITGSGLAGYKMNKRFGNLETFKFQELTNIKQLHVTIAISGWLPADKAENGFFEPWMNLWHSKEQFYLVYETTHLIRLGRALGDMYRKVAASALQQTIARTIMSGLMTAIALPAFLLKFSKIIDNPWGVCTERANAAGRELADVLQARVQGNRPISLIGFSMGARVIFFCVQELALRQGCNNILQDVIMLGAPVTAALEDWMKMRDVVSGRIINGYCSNDWLLKFVHRTLAVEYTIAGLQKIEIADRRMENVDLTEIVEGHLDYAHKMPQILKKLNIRTHGGDKLVQVPQEPNSVFYLDADEDHGEKEVSSVEMTELQPSCNYKTENGDQGVENIFDDRGVDNGVHEPSSSRVHDNSSDDDFEDALDTVVRKTGV